MKKYLKRSLQVVVALLGLWAIYGGVVAWSHYTYFAAAVDSYIAAQKIPASAIKSRTISYNSQGGTNTYPWVEAVYVRGHHQLYEYDYQMGWGVDHNLPTLTVMLNNSEVNVKQAPYQPLKYDRQALED